MLLQWDKTGERQYETGVDKGVLYPFKNGAYQKGVAWSGLTAVNESPSGAENTSVYADNIKYLTLTSAEEYGFTIEAYQSPEEFDECDGCKEVAPGVSVGQQTRTKFGFAHRTKIGNDTDGDAFGYKIHIAYGCTASPSEKNYQTVNDNPEAMNLSWTVSTTPIAVAAEGCKPTALLTIDSTKISAKALKAIEDALYGTADTEARILTPDEIVEIVTEADKPEPSEP